MAIAHAVERGYTVATARPTLAEATLGFAVLADLLRRADLSVRPDAPRHVLETALGQRAATHEPPTSSELGRAPLHEHQLMHDCRLEPVAPTAWWRLTAMAGDFVGGEGGGGGNVQ